MINSRVAKLEKSIFMRIIFLLTAFVISASGFSQSFKNEWVKSFGSSYSADVSDLTADDEGNIYTLGEFYGSADFDFSSGEEILSSWGNRGVYILKTDSVGNFIWAKSFGSRGADRGNAIHIDNNGHVLVVGKFNGISSIDPSGDDPDYAGNGQEDGYVAKFSGAGDLIWTSIFEGEGRDEVNDVTTDSNNNVYVTGTYKLEIDLDAGIDESNFTSNGNSIGFIEKLDEVGNYVWAHVIKNWNSNASYGFKVLENSGSLYWLGGITNSFDFDFGSGTATKSEEGLVLLKIDLDAVFQWVRQYKTDFSPFNYSRSLLSDNDNNIFVMADYGAVLYLEEGNAYYGKFGNQFVEKLDSDGSLNWNLSLSADTTFGFSDMQLDYDGNMLLAGSFRGDVDVDPSEHEVIAAAENKYNNLLILQLNGDGEYFNHKGYGGVYNQNIQNVLPTRTGELIVAGEFYDSTNFSTVKDDAEVVSSIGQRDVYIQKLSMCSPTYGIDTVTACDSLTWLDGLTYYDNNDSALFCTVNKQGCDSIVTLNLSITKLDLTVIKDNNSFVAQEEGAIFQWLNCENDYTQVGGEFDAIFKVNANGVFAVEVMKNGCIDTTECLEFIENNELFGLIGGSEANDLARAITSDDEGNLYVTGLFYETIDFDPGPGITELTSVGFDDVFVLKFSPMGNLAWAKSFGGKSVDYVQDIEIDNEGNLVIVGGCYKTVDYDPSENVFNLTVDVEGMYVVKLDNDGNFIWAKTMETEDDAVIQSVAIDSKNSILLCGHFNSATDMNPDSLISEIVSPAFPFATAGFILKLDSSGNLTWNKVINGEILIYALKIAIAPNDEVITMGYSHAGVDLDPGEEVYWVQNSSFSDKVVFIQKLSSNGEFVWGQVFGRGGSYACTPSGLAIDNAGDIIFSYYGDGRGGDLNKYYSFNIQKVLNDGSEGWLTKLDTVLDQATNRGNVSINDGGEIAVAAVYSGTPTSLGFNTFRKDGFVLSLDNEGMIVNSQSLGGDLNYISDVEMEESGDITIVGHYYYTAIFNGVEKNSKGKTDLFVQRLRACPSIFTFDSIFSCDPYTWIDGETYTSSTNSATYILNSVGGCDTVVKLDLTIQNVDRSIEVNGLTLSFDVKNDTIQWLNCSDNYAVIDSEADSVYSVEKSGSYAVKVSSKGCLDTTSCETVIVVGLDDVSDYNFHVSPNPTNGMLKIEASQIGILYELLSVEGKVLKAITSNNFVNQLDLSSLSKGIYWLKGGKNQKIIIKKIVVK